MCQDPEDVSFQAMGIAPKVLPGNLFGSDADDWVRAPFSLALGLTLASDEYSPQSQHLIDCAFDTESHSDRASGGYSFELYIGFRLSRLLM